MQQIPMSIWFLAYAGTAFACFHWHNRQGSPHLRTMAFGICVVALLLLPSLFVEWTSHDQLTRYAEFIMPVEDAGSVDYYHGEPQGAGARLLNFCNRISWIGYSVFALGIWRFSKELAIKADPHPFDPA